MPAPETGAVKSATTILPQKAAPDSRRICHKVRFEPAHLRGDGAMTTTFDAIIIGTGQAGPSLAGRLTAAGMKVAIIERGRFGGTCVNTGCTPTKTMVASAYAAHIARRAADFGVSIGASITVDMKEVKARRDAITGKSSTGIESWLK